MYLAVLGCFRSFKGLRSVGGAKLLKLALPGGGAKLLKCGGGPYPLSQGPPGDETLPRPARPTFAFMGGARLGKKFRHGGVFQKKR